MERLGMTVIGSGPAAMAATYGLVKQGRHVTILDAGIDLEPERQGVVDYLAPLDSLEWDRASVRVLREGAGATAAGVPLKRVYGSDFPYRGAADRLALECDHVTAFSSLARGGLSNVWGAAIMPHRLSDLADWPSAARSVLGSAYAGVFEFLPLAAVEDDLASKFPLFAHRVHSFAPSPQAKALLDRMHLHRDALLERGVTFGRARLAVTADDDEGRQRCIYCGMCMYGCPRELIYKSSHTLDALVRSGRVTYVPNIVVDQLTEDADTVYIHAHDRLHGGNGTFKSDRVFVGCGTLSTARLMLDSLRATDVKLTMRDSQYFLLPVMALKGQARVSATRLHTLAQVFIEIEDARLSAYPIHLQVYTYNDLYASVLRKMFGPAHRVISPPASMLLNRLMVIQGYLHSNVSSSASITLDREKLSLRRNQNMGAAQSVQRVARMLQRNSRRFGFVPISPMLKVGDPGQGAHIGGTFPMRSAPGPFESDLLGRPNGSQRVHLVDGSVLPSIPATTVTLSIMANAYRIASEVVRHV